VVVQWTVQLDLDADPAQVVDDRIGDVRPFIAAHCDLHANSE
jgi:hypothetical protein